MKPVQTRRGLSKRKSSIRLRSSKKPNWPSISSLKNEGQSRDERNSRERKLGDDEKSIIHYPSLNHIISPQFPDYSKLVIRRYKVSPYVQMHKSPYLISSDEEWIKNNNNQDDQKEIISVAFKSCKNSMLEYLNTD